MVKSNHSSYPVFSNDLLVCYRKPYLTSVRFSSWDFPGPSFSCNGLVIMEVFPIVPYAVSLGGRIGQYMGRLSAIANVPHSYDDSGLDASLVEVLRTDIPFRLLVVPNTLSIFTHSSTESISSAKSTLRRVSHLHDFLRTVGSQTGPSRF
jgi:hypothetical protein